jgi:membrane associated rhomboid family serine protease
MTGPATPGWGRDPAASLTSDVGRPGPLDDDVAVGLLQRAQALADQGDWDLAAGTFARVVGSADATLHTAALLGLAECRYRLDDEPAALQAWIAATQAPENPLTWRAWKALAAARVRSSDVPGAARGYREAVRRAPASEQPELQSRIGWLSKELGDDRGSQRAFGRSRTSTVNQPVVTYGLLAVTTVVSLAILLGRQDELRSWLLLDKFSLLFGNEYWRLLTVVLVHGSLIHLLFNMYALWVIGPVVEALYGPWRYLGIYALCGIAGSAASFATSPNPAVGASGAVFGLFGALLVADRVHKPALTRNARNLTAQIGVLIGINLLIGFVVPGIDNSAHIGGLLAGAWLGFVLLPRGPRLGSFWSPPQGAVVGRPGAAVSGPGGLAGLGRSALLREVGGVAALLGIVVVIVVAGPFTWQVSDFFVGSQPGVTAKALPDAVGVAALGATVALRVPVLVGVPVLLVGLWLGRAVGGSGLALSVGQRHIDDHGAARRPVRPLIAQEQAPPGRDAPG